VASEVKFDRSEPLPHPHSKLPAPANNSGKADYYRWGDWKCGSGKCDTVKNARMENAGV